MQFRSARGDTMRIDNMLKGFVEGMPKNLLFALARIVEGSV